MMPMYGVMCVMMAIRNSPQSGGSFVNPVWSAATCGGITEAEKHCGAVPRGVIEAQLRSAR